MGYDDAYAAAATALGTPRITEAELTLVNAILQKTREGKVHWTRVASGHRGQTLDGLLTIEIATVRTVISGDNWSSFAVRRHGEEILRVENTAAGWFALLGVSQPRLESGISELLAYLEGSRARNLTSAVSELERL